MLHFLFPLLLVLQSIVIKSPVPASEQPQSYRLHQLTQKEGVSIRGLSVVDDQVAWISGSQGWTAVSSNRGKDWQWQQVPSHEKTDFRSLYAFSKDKAIVMSAGSPLVILKTEDAGKTWKEAHRNEHPDIFLDGMDFWDEKRGIAYGDPIDGQMQILTTNDGGNTWQDMSEYTKGLLQEGEAGFAASGTGIRTLPNGTTIIGTGGSRAQILITKDFGKNWTAYPCPIIQGNVSTGIFSIAFASEQIGVVVGGNYEEDLKKEKVVFLTKDGGKTWIEPKKGTNGYRSSVEYLNKNVLIATGTTGVDLSLDGGLNWSLMNYDSFHAVRKARKGNWVLLAGAHGRIAMLMGTKKTLYSHAPIDEAFNDQPQ